MHLPPLIAGVTPPDWLRAELRNRLVLALNHVLMQEPAAMQRLARHKGKGVRMVWGAFDLVLRTTPAGLWATDSAPAIEPDLTLTVQSQDPKAMVQAFLAGAKPAVDIQGDVQLAAEVAWLVDNVRWDAEEDLAHVLGDGPAHIVVAQAQRMLGLLKGFLQKGFA